MPLIKKLIYKLEVPCQSPGMQVIKVDAIMQNMDQHSLLMMPKDLEIKMNTNNNKKIQGGNLPVEERRTDEER